MVRSRILIFAISTLVLTVSLSGCSDNNDPNRWIKTDNKDFGMTAKQGYVNALEKINGTYITPPITVFLTMVQGGHDITRLGKGTFWRFYFCILNNTDQYKNLSVEIFSNGTRNLQERLGNVTNPPKKYIQNWTVDSDKAMSKGIERDDIEEYVNREI